MSRLLNKLDDFPQIWCIVFSFIEISISTGKDSLLRMSFLKGTNEGHLLSRTGMDIKIIVISPAY